MPGGSENRFSGFGSSGASMPAMLSISSKNKSFACIVARADQVLLWG
jgi:hypothetical protein